MSNKLIVSNKDPSLLLGVEEVILEIEASLASLKDFAKLMDPADADINTNYLNNLRHLKRFYERAEKIILENKNEQKTQYSAVDNVVGETTVKHANFSQYYKRKKY